MKTIRLTNHASEQCEERGANEEEVKEVVLKGSRENTKKGRFLCKLNFQYDDLWNGKYYKIKQVAAVIAEEENEIVVIPVYIFYF